MPMTAGAYAAGDPSTLRSDLTLSNTHTSSGAAGNLVTSFRSEQSEQPSTYDHYSPEPQTAQQSQLSAADDEIVFANSVAKELTETLVEEAGPGMSIHPRQDANRTHEVEVDPGMGDEKVGGGGMGVVEVELPPGVGDEEVGGGGMGVVEVELDPDEEGEGHGGQVWRMVV